MEKQNLKNRHGISQVSNRSDGKFVLELLTQTGQIHFYLVEPLENPEGLKYPERMIR